MENKNKMSRCFDELEKKSFLKMFMWGMRYDICSHIAHAL